MRNTLFALLLLSASAIGQISGAGNIGCSGTAVTGAAWNTATSNNTIQSLVANFGATAALVQLDQTTTITGGAVTFQISYDGGTNYISAPVVQVVNPSTGAQLTNPYTLQASTNKAFYIPLAGATNLQLKLTTAITGTGAITPYTTAVCTPIQPTADASGNLNVNVQAEIATPAGSNLIGKVGIDQTTPGTTNAVAETNLPTTVDTNSGTKSASTLRVVLATDQPALTNKLLVTPDSVALPANQSVNVAQFGGTNASTGTGAGGAGIPRVTVSNDSSLTGTLSSNGAAATTNRMATLPCIARTDLQGGTAATAGRDLAPDCGTDGLLHVATLPDLSAKRYRASSKFAASSTTDNWRISGNASNTVIVTKLSVTCTETTAGIVPVQLIKRSAAASGGTSASVTAVPLDSNKAAASSVVNSYTGTGPTVGASVGDIDDAQFGCMAAGTATANDIYVPATSPGAPIAVLRGTAEGVALNFGGALTGGNLTVSVEWAEVTTITP